MADGNAFSALADKARTTPSWMLLGVELVGVTGALAVYAWSPERSSTMFPLLAIAAFGLFGTIDHVLEAPPRLRSWRRSVLRSFRLLAGAAGVLSAAATAFLLAGWMIGTFIS